MDQHFSALRRASLAAALAAAAAFGVGCSGAASGAAGKTSAAIVLPALDIVAGKPSGQGYVDGMSNDARFSYPSGMRFDGAGNLFVADMRNSVIRRIGRDGNVATVAGAVGMTGSADGKGTAARFNYPADVAVDGAGVVYVADSSNNTIRKVDPDGTVSTFAGAAGQAGASDGSATEARFNGPNGLVLDGQGNLYVADSWNSVIRKITPAGRVSTLAGTAGAWGHADGSGAAAQFKNPMAITIDRAGLLYVTDGSTVRSITPAGEVTTIAGADGQDGETDGTGAAARFNGAGGIAADGAGNLFVADGGGNTIRKIAPGGVVTTLAGSGSIGSQNGTGRAASFKGPNRVAVDTQGKVYVTDNNSAIRRIDAAGVVGTWAGALGETGSVDGPALAARFSFPNGVALDQAGNVYVADQDNSTVRKLGLDGKVATIAGGVGVWGYADGAGAAARFNGVGGVAVAPDGTVYLSEFYSHTIRKIGPDGKVSTLAGAAGEAGNADGIGPQARFNGPNCVAVDRQGNVYVADYNNNTIRRITPAGAVGTIAGNGQAGAVDGIGAAARFNGPNSIAIDAAGNLFITDAGNNTIRKMTPGGVVSTVAGLAGAVGYANGMDKTARFSYPWGIAVDQRGNLYVADSGNNAVRLVSPAGKVSTLIGTGTRYANMTGPLPAGIAFPIGVAVDEGHHRVLVTAPDAIVSIPVQQ